MAPDLTKINPELEALFRKYESAPDSHVFAPLADAYRKAGMLEEAVEICRKGLRKHPDYPSGHVVEGKCHFDVGKLDESEASFRKVLELDENNLVALKYLGMIQAGRGRLDEAGRFFKDILALDPGNREIKGMLDDIREVEHPSTAGRTVDGPDRSGEDEDFEGDTIDLGARDELSDDLATTTLADIYAAQGFRGKAGRIYREILRSQPDNDEVRRKLVALERGGGSEQAPRAKAPTGQAAPSLEQKAAPAEDEGHEDVALEASADDMFDDEPTARDRLRERVDGGRRESKQPERKKSAGRTLDEQRSYDQFKRWLENVKK
jgi:tetratricopeptide (TPR) repeat protein